MPPRSSINRQRPANSCLLHQQLHQLRLRNYPHLHALKLTYRFRSIRFDWGTGHGSEQNEHSWQIVKNLVKIFRSQSQNGEQLNLLPHALDKNPLKNAGKIVRHRKNNNILIFVKDDRLPKMQNILRLPTPLRTQTNLLLHKNPQKNKKRQFH